MTWNGVFAATNYEVWRSASNNIASASILGTTASTTYDDLTNATIPRTVLYYWVKAANAVSTSEFSTGDSGFAGHPAVNNDYDGDGKSDLAVYREVTAIGPST